MGSTAFKFSADFSHEEQFEQTLAPSAMFFPHLSTCVEKEDVLQM